MSKKAIFQRYVQLAEVLGQMFPQVLEAVVHDFSDLDHAIVFIVNGHISGREVGGPVSELNMRRLLEEDRFPDTLVNYESRSPTGQRIKSSSVAIRDEKGKITGAFCLHFDISGFEQFQNFLNLFVGSKTQELIGINVFGEQLPLEQEIKNAMKAWLIKEELYSTQISYKDKKQLVEHLYAQGYFQKHGAISIVANLLQLTRQCIYNYLAEAKER